MKPELKASSVCFMKERVTYDKDVQTMEVQTEPSFPDEEEIRQRITREKEAEAERLAKEREFEAENEKLEQEIRQEIRGTIFAFCSAYTR